MIRHIIIRVGILIFLCFSAFAYTYYESNAIHEGETGYYLKPIFLIFAILQVAVFFAFCMLAECFWLNKKSYKNKLNFNIAISMFIFAFVCFFARKWVFGY